MLIKGDVTDWENYTLDAKLAPCVKETRFVKDMLE